MEFPDVLFTPGQDQIPGVKTVLSWIHKSDIETWPTAPKAIADAVTAAEAVSYTGDFTIKTGKKFKKLYGTQGKGKGSFSAQGEKDNKSFLNKASFSHPTLSAEMRMFSRAAINDDIIILLSEVDGDGSHIVIGDPSFQISCTIEGDTGDAATSAKAIVVSMECTSKWALPTYSGTISYTEAV